MKSQYTKYIFTAGFTFLMSCFSCNDFLTVDPPRTQIANNQVFSTDATVTSAITGIYSSMMTSGAFTSGSSNSMTLQAGLSADEYIDLANTAVSRQFYRNSIDITNSTVDNFWTNLYQYIFYANTILEQIDQASTVTPLVRNQVKGEALFIRAFCHFYLVNLFGDVPLITLTDYKINSLASRTSAPNVYAKIIEDLLQAKNLMGADYTHAAGNRVRPNKFAATALLARVYLFTNQWQDAEAQATSVISNSTMYEILTDLNTVFLKNSREAIWQLMPVQPQFNTYEGTTFHGLSIAALSAPLIQSFEANDLRRTRWVINQTSGTTTYQSPFKYKVGVTGQPVTEYSMVLRLAECFLIRAEARAHQQNFIGSNSDINMIRRRAGLPDVNYSSEAELTSEILNQRRAELFSEWGHRWLDLKRTGTADAVLQTIKAEWTDTDVLYPIPKLERDNNPNLSQNPGY